MAASARDSQAGSRIGRAARRILADNAVALAKAPKVAADLAGKAWNSPNTILGLGVGVAGHVAGELNRLRPGGQPIPRIRLGHNAVEFMNNPAGGVSAITLGNATIYNDDRYAMRDEPYMAHEEAHTRQGQQLGPLYLPSNLAGGLLALARDGDWHGQHNWNERGPMQSPPTPWAPRRRR